MPELNETIVSALVSRYTKLGGTVRDLATPLTNEQFWSKPFSFGNSFGHLVLHLTGNLNHYIGSAIANTGYLRDRPREFTEAAPPAKEAVMKNFDSTLEMVVRTIRSQSVDDWSKPYAAMGADANNRFEMVLQCAAHLDHHVGQLMYLAFELKQRT
jgi:hypothetical protein